VRQLLDGTSGAQTLVNYDPFGNPLDGMGLPRTSFGFTGEQTDPTGLIYLRARYYNPQFGSFLSRDPFGGWMDDSGSQNGYSYTGANPVNYVDPSGKLAWIPLIIGAAKLLWAGAKVFAFSAAVSGAFSAGAQQMFKGSVNWAQVKVDALEGGILGLIGFPIGGAIGRLGFRGIRAGLLNFGADVAIGAAWDMSVHHELFGDAFASNLIGGIVGERIGNRVGRFAKTLADWKVGRYGGNIRAKLRDEQLVTVYRYANRTQPATLLARSSNWTFLVDLPQRLLMKHPKLRQSRIELHAEGGTWFSPFVSLGLDKRKLVETHDSWLLEIIEKSDYVAKFEVPESRLYYPQNRLSTNETEVMFMGDDLDNFLVDWEINPFRRQ